MRMGFYVTVLTLVSTLVLGGGYAQAQMTGQPGMMGTQPVAGVQQPAPQAEPGGFICPNCGSSFPRGTAGYGYGMMQPGTPGYGYGMMQPGTPGYGYGMMQPGTPGYGYGMMQPGPRGYGYGMMQPGTPGYGYGMMQPGMMYPGNGPQGAMGYFPQRTEPMAEKDVKAMVEYHLANFVRNPNLKLGKIKEKGEAFEVEIVTRDGSLVNRFLVDRNTGWMQPAD